MKCMCLFSQGEKEQPVFALMGLRWGAFRDVASKISKYDYSRLQLDEEDNNSSHIRMINHNISRQILVPRTAEDKCGALV